MSFKKKKQLYITRRSERHHTQTTHANNTHNKILHHHILGEELEESHRNPRRRHQRCGTPKAATRCELKWPPELLHHGLSPTSRTHTIVDPSASA